MVASRAPEREPAMQTNRNNLDICNATRRHAIVDALCLCPFAVVSPMKNNIELHGDRKKITYGLVRVSTTNYVSISFISSRSRGFPFRCSFLLQERLPFPGFAFTDLVDLKRLIIADALIWRGFGGQFASRNRSIFVLDRCSKWLQSLKATPMRTK